MKKLLSLSLMVMVSVALYSCGSSSSDSASGKKTGISIGGTGGGAGTGGDGGNYTVALGTDSTGDITIKKTGSVDTSFTVPDMSGFDTGVNPLEVTTDMTVVFVADGATTDPAEFVPYMLSGDPTIYISDADDSTGDEAAVTGIEVSKGKTLTFELNDVETQCGGGHDSAEFVVSGDIVNYGTITTADKDATERGTLDIIAENYYGFANSKIDTRGTLDGQSGGFILIYPNTSFYNLGNFYANGAEGVANLVDGGNGGYIEIYNKVNPGELYNKGNMYTFGGNSDTGNGGHGHSLSLTTEVYPSNLYNSGDYFGYGGDGYIDGGLGGVGTCNYDTLIETWEDGSTTMSGNIDVRGGTGETGTGGDAGDVNIGAYGTGDLLASGTYNTTGGDALAVDQNAGAGGDIFLTATAGTGIVGSIESSVRYDVSGGDANDEVASTGLGGAAGNVSISVAGALADQSITVITNQITTDGGDGGAGGNGGYVDIRTNTGGTGNINNSVNISTNGGNATTTGNNGGTAGYVTIHSIGGSVDVNASTELNGGDSMGSATNTTGTGSWLNLISPSTISLKGSVSANGGDDLDLGEGNNAGGVYVYSTGGDIDVNSTIKASGGDGGSLGGAGAWIEIGNNNSDNVSFTGSVTAYGGSATEAGSTGGQGSCVTIYNDTVPTADGGATGPAASKVKVDGGTGDAGDGNDGGYYVDAAFVTGDTSGRCGAGDPPQD